MRNGVELFLLFTVALVLFLQGVSLVSERSDAIQNARRRGLSCMALVDPTMIPETDGNDPSLQGVDPQTAVYLQQVDAQGVAFLSSHWDAQVTLLDGPTYRSCFGRSNSNNQVGTDAIFLNQERLPTPKLRAIAITHEIVHAEHGHPDATRGRERFLQFIITEEGEAHLADQMAAIRLHTKSLDSPVAAVVGYIGTLPLLYGWLLLTAHRCRAMARTASRTTEESVQEPSSANLR